MYTPVFTSAILCQPSSDYFSNDFILLLVASQLFGLAVLRQSFSCMDFQLIKSAVFHIIFSPGSCK